MSDLNSIYNAELAALNNFRATYGSAMGSGNTWDAAMIMLHAARQVGANQVEAFSALNAIMQTNPDLRYNADDLSFIQLASSGIFQ